MARLPILEYPDPRLRIPATAVTTVDAATRALIADLFETMYEAGGIGLAATQVNVQQRILVIDPSDRGNQPYCFINPEILTAAGAANREEGCLSVPGVFETVSRAERVTVRALDREAEPFELEADGLLAVCIQHEIDHLDGKLFVDYLSELKRERLKKRLLKKAKRETETGDGVPARASGRVL